MIINTKKIEIVLDGYKAISIIYRKEKLGISRSAITKLEMVREHSKFN